LSPQFQAREEVFPVMAAQRNVVVVIKGVAAGGMVVIETVVKGVVRETAILESGIENESETVSGVKGIEIAMSCVIVTFSGTANATAKRENAIQNVIAREGSNGNGIVKGNGWNGNVLSLGGGASAVGLRRIGRIGSVVRGRRGV
jgi:hypothetical protein